MSRYAENTSVSADKSRAEIESLLRRYGADSFAYMTSRVEARIATLLIAADLFVGGFSAVQAAEDDEPGRVP